MRSGSQHGCIRWDWDQQRRIRVRGSWHDDEDRNKLGFGFWTHAQRTVLVADRRASECEGGVAGAVRRTLEAVAGRVLQSARSDSERDGVNRRRHHWIQNKRVLARARVGAVPPYKFGECSFIGQRHYTGLSGEIHGRYGHGTGYANFTPRQRGTCRFSGVALPMFKGFTAGLDKGKTFRPRRHHKAGTKRYELHKYAQATLGAGNLHDAVTLPEGEDLNEWLAVNVVDFFNEM